MKWIPLAKAKVKFDQQYLVAAKGFQARTATLFKSEQTAGGVTHRFVDDIGNEVKDATYIAIITDPNDEAGKLVG